MLEEDEADVLVHVLRETAVVVLSIAARVFVVLLFFYDVFPERWPF